LRAKIESCLPQAGKILEARPSERLDFFAAWRLCEQKKKIQEARYKKQETGNLSADRQVRVEKQNSRLCIDFFASLRLCAQK
jgi:hypothetical protein